MYGPLNLIVLLCLILLSMTCVFIGTNDIITILRHMMHLMMWRDESVGSHDDTSHPIELEEGLIQLFVRQVDGKTLVIKTPL